MTSARWVLVCAGTLSVAVGAAGRVSSSGREPAWDEAGSGDRALRWMAPSHDSSTRVPGLPGDPDTVIQSYCVDCHNDVMKTGGLSLESFVIAATADHVEVAEKMVRKLRAGMMPPPDTTPPDLASYNGLIAALETRLDQAAAARPNPGNRPFQRLNRVEYARSIQELLALDVNAGTWLPLDSMSANFDNIADEQMLSATLLEAFLNAAGDISRMAIGDRKAPPLDRTYANTSYASQHPWDHVEGAPYGTRGGMVVKHVFPADAEYVFQVNLTGGNNSRLEDIDISINGERVSLIQYETQPSGGADGRGGVPMRTEPVLVRAGQHAVAAAFVRRTEGPYEDLIRPHDWSFAGGGSGGAGITTLPHLRDLIIRGPFRTMGVSESPSRRQVFFCRPTSAAEERPCARAILGRLASVAYRRVPTSQDIDALMQFYEGGRATDGFEVGVRTALEALLASPHFIFRLERQPVQVKAGDIFRISDTDLASRLSFFLWGTPPDDTLLTLASQGRLSPPAALEAQARRMLADPRAEGLGTRFAAQWLRLQDVDKVKPDPNFFPNFDDRVAASMKRETITFFNELVRRDGSAMDLYRADYTYLDERLARHYGIPNVAGPQFRRVSYPDDTRRGLLGHGSVLVQTSMANRTSPVLRGKWVMEVLMGTPPPPPAPNVPPLENTAGSRGGRPLTTRERMEVHREDPQCRSCHLYMDPIGLALDQFDVTARWRVRENGLTLDPRGTFYDGTPLASPADLSAVLLKRPVPLARTLTENLLAYALGRRPEYYDQPTVRAIARQAEANTYRMSSFILGVITSDAFRLRRADVVPDTPSPVGRR